MSIALATNGRLWPVARIIREQFQDITVIVVDPVEINMVMEDVTEIAVTVSTDEIVTTVELVDSATGEVIVSDISGNTEGCS